MAYDYLSSMASARSRSEASLASAEARWLEPPDDPPVFCECAECGMDIYYGDACYQIGDKYFCEDCVYSVEAGEDEYDEY